MPTGPDPQRHAAVGLSAQCCVRTGAMPTVLQRNADLYYITYTRCRVSRDLQDPQKNAMLNDFKALISCLWAA